MKIVLPAFASVVLAAGCASSGGGGTTLPAAPADESATGAAVEPTPETAALMASATQVEVSATEEREVCHRVFNLGSRISRVRCEVEADEATKNLQEVQTDFEIEYAREVEAFLEQQRAEDFANGNQQEQQP